MDPIQESSTAAPPSAGISEGEPLATAVAQASANHAGAGSEPEKRKRGNPNWIKGVKRSVGVTPPPLPTGANQSSSQADPSPPIDKKLVAESVASVFKAIDSVICRHVYVTAMLVSNNDKAFANQNVQSAAITQVELDGISKLSAEVCERHAILGQYAPEALLVVFMLGYGTRTLITVGKLKGLAKEIELSRKRNAT